MRKNPLPAKPPITQMPPHKDISIVQMIDPNKSQSPILLIALQAIQNL